MAGEASEFDRLVSRAIRIGILVRLHSFQKSTFRELQWSPYDLVPEVLELNGTGLIIEQRYGNALDDVRFAWKSMFDANKARIETAIQESAPVQAARAIKTRRRIAFQLQHVKFVAEPYVLYFNSAGTPRMRARAVTPKSEWIGPLRAGRLRNLKRLKDWFEFDPAFDLSKTERAGLICCGAYLDDLGFGHGDRMTHQHWRATGGFK